jgi:pyruvate dehydrogenase E1 component beta subunit
LVELNIVQAVKYALEQEMARDPNVIILGEDVGRNGGVFRATEGL